MNGTKLLQLIALTVAYRPVLALPQPQRRPAGPIERLRRMAPDQRRRTLDPLPPDRRKQAERRLEQLDALPPSERDALQRRYEAFQKLPPGKQQQAREVFRRLNELDTGDRHRVQSEMDSLFSMTEKERTERVKSSSFKKKFNRKEQSILSDYSSLLDEKL